MSYDLSEHRHRFAVWAAARASQRGFTTVGHLREALESRGVRAALADANTLNVSPIDFDALHRQWCTTICARLYHASVANVTYGRAAKLVAVYLEAMVVVGKDCDTPLSQHLHPPIDGIL